MKLKMIVAACALVASGVVLADSYQTELNADATRVDSDSTKDKTTSYNVGGSYYFNAVKTDNVPLAESAYLGKNSNVFASANLFPKQNGISSNQAYTLGAEFYIPESFLYVSAGGSHSTLSHVDNNDWFTTVGITPIDGLLITTEYAHNAGYDANIHAKYVTDIGGGQFVNLEAGATDADHGTDAHIGGDFYFDKTFSVGGDIENYRSDNAYTLRARKFFTDTFSGQLSYKNAPDGNTLTVGLSARF